MLRLLRLTGGIALAFAILLVARPAPHGERQVVFHPANRAEAVVITEVTLGNAVVQKGRFVQPRTVAPDPVTPFQAGDDWVQNLTVHFLNRTNRTIVCASLYFSFPETGDGRTVPRREFRLVLGRIPVEVAFDPRGRILQEPTGREPLLFRRGQTMAIALGDYTEQIRANVEPGIPLAVATTLNIDFGAVYFADGTRWESGNLYRTFDPKTFAWRRLDPNFFPGDMDRNWQERQ